MPRSTVEKAWEWRLFDWALRYRGGAGFVVIVAEDGKPAQIHDGDGERRLVPHERAERLRQNAAHWIFFDPFDPPVYAWLEWQEVTQAMWESLLGDKLDEPEFPASHSVMF
jgi:hypothetical protein